MGAVELRNIILSKLNTIEDSSVLTKVLDFVETIKNKKSEGFSLTETQLNKIDEMRAKYITGEGKTFSWQDINKNLSISMVYKLNL